MQLRAIMKPDEQMSVFAGSLGLREEDEAAAHSQMEEQREILPLKDEILSPPKAGHEPMMQDFLPDVSLGHWIYDPLSRHSHLADPLSEDQPS
jgi:hypothetical protein